MGDQKTVIVIEDSATQALHLRLLLEQYNLRVLVAVNGKQGLALIEAILPDLVLLDLQMPEMNGFEVCQHIKAIPQLQNIPIIMFTALDDQESVMKGLQMGALDFIPKDVFADAVLLETLRQMGIIAVAEKE